MTDVTDSTQASQTSGPVPGFEFLSYVLEQIVEDKDQLNVSSQIDDLGILLTVRVSPKDMGKLIGKSGQTIKSLRTLLRVLGGISNQRINLKVMEPEV